MLAQLAFLMTEAIPGMAGGSGFADIVERNLPSVVRIVTTGAQSGEASGVIISANGL